MTEAEEMAKLGFTHNGLNYVRDDIVIRVGFGARRPWYATHGKAGAITLCANGDMIDSGRMRKFATPMAAAKAAMEKWL